MARWTICSRAAARWSVRCTRPSCCEHWASLSSPNRSKRREDSAAKSCLGASGPTSGWISQRSGPRCCMALARRGPAKTRSTRRSPASGWRGFCSTTRSPSHPRLRARSKAGFSGCRPREPERKRGRAPKSPPPSPTIALKAPGGADRLELLARALGHGGLEALLAHALEEGRVGFGLDDAVELAPVGRHEADAVDLQIVDAPATVTQM